MRRVARGRRHAEPSGGRPRRRWLLAFLGFFLLGAGWALAAPYDGSPDEIQHIIRAVGVARGEVAPTPTTAGAGTGAFQDIPASLIRTNCWAFQPGTPAACAVPPGGDSHIVKTPTRAGRYNPVYYLLVGWPMALWPTMKGVLFARLISAALSAAFLAMAANSAVRATRHRITLAGVLAGITPITLHLAGAINPNGLEISAGVALCALLVPLFLDPEAELRPGILVQVALAGSVLMFLRSLGPLWVLSIIGILLLPTRRALLGSLLRSKGVRWAAVLLGAVGVGSVAWTVIMKTSQIGIMASGWTFTFQDVLRFELVSRWVQYANELIGVMSWLDTQLPGTVYQTWYMALGLLIMGALACGTWSDRWRILALLVVTFAVPSVSEITTVNKYGFVAQGRYMLPIAVGIPILAAFVLGLRNVLNDRHSAKVSRFIGVLVMALHLLFLAWTMIRWQIGQPLTIKGIFVNPLAGKWHPMVGSVVPLACAAAGAAFVLWFTWATTRPRSEPVEASGIPQPAPALAAEG